MANGLFLRLLAAAFMVLTLPPLTPVVSRCAGQETGGGVDGLGRPRAARDARRVADREATARVLVTEVRAWLLVLGNPDEAYDLLKGVHQAIRNDPALSDSCRERLQSRLEGALQGVAECGGFVKRLDNALRNSYRARLAGWRFQLERWRTRLGL